MKTICVVNNGVFKVNELLKKVQADLDEVVSEWLASDYLQAADLFVIGCSTSEVAGKHIGTSGSEEIAEVIFNAFQQLSEAKDIHVVYQCCEHLNRALVMERDVQLQHHLEEVSVVPIRAAGGAMAAYAYQSFNDAVVVEALTANAGIDIGDTMIGMHLRQVAVPIRFQQKTIGNAHITLARTRPKLIGGARATYE